MNATAKVKGEIFFEYAFFRYEFIFNKENTGACAEYRFSLPQGAVISALKMIDGDGRILKASVVSASHAEALWNSEYGSVVLRRENETAYSLRLGGANGEECKISVSLYAPVQRDEAGAFMALPICCSAADVDIVINGASNVSVSPAGIVERFEYSSVVKVCGEELGKELFLRFDTIDKSSAIAVCDGIGYEMLCKLYTNSGIGENLVISADGAEITVLSVEKNSVLLYARGFGDILPSDFEVLSSGGRTHIYIEEKGLYKSFAPIGLVCAEHIYKELLKRLDYCLPEQIAEIKTNIEEVGIKFSALNSETAMVIVSEGRRPMPVRVVVPDTAGRRTVDKFKEDSVFASSIESEKNIEHYRDIIIRSMRARGAVCATGEVNPEIAKAQTVLCVLALISAGMGERLGGFIDVANRYIDGYVYKNLSFTKNEAEAREMLREFYGGSIVSEIEKPDLITAARLMWQISCRNIRNFC